MQDKCSVKGCCRKIAVKKHRLCTPHYARLKRKGTPDGPPILVKVPIPAWKADEEEKHAIMG